MNLQLWEELLNSLSDAEHIYISDDKEYYAVTLSDKLLEELAELAADNLAIKQRESR